MQWKMKLWQEISTQIARKSYLPISLCPGKIPKLLEILSSTWEFQFDDVRHFFVRSFVHNCIFSNIVELTDSSKPVLARSISKLDYTYIFMKKKWIRIQMNLRGKEIRVDHAFQPRVIHVILLIRICLFWARSSSYCHPFLLCHFILCSPRLQSH